MINTTATGDASNNNLDVYLKKPMPLLSGSRWGGYMVALSALCSSVSCGLLVKFPGQWRMLLPVACSMTSATYILYRAVKKADEPFSGIKYIDPVTSSTAGIRDVVALYDEEFKNFASGQSRLSLIAQGSWGVIGFLTLDESDKDAKIAVKHVSKNVKESELWTFQEAEVLAELRSEHVVHLYGYHDGLQRILLIMEKCQTDLAHYISCQANPASEVKRLKAASECMASVAYMHEKNYLHRDIKPNNFLMKADGCWVICDTAFARRENRDDSRVCGTSEYVAPEYIDEDLSSFGSDAWSMGIVLLIVANFLERGEEHYCCGAGNDIRCNYTSPESMHKYFEGKFSIATLGQRPLPYKTLLKPDFNIKTETLQGVDACCQVLNVAVQMLRIKASDRLLPVYAAPVLKELHSNYVKKKFKQDR